MKIYSKLAVLGVVLSSSVIASATDITIDTYGYLGAIYNQEFSDNKDSTISLTARAGADFYFQNGISIGFGAAGAWAAYDKNDSVYPNTGDISDAYFKYKANDWVIAVGRYDASFLQFDWLNNNTEGIGFKYDNLGIKGLDLWITYFDSVLLTGYQPNRIGSELGTFYAYHPGGRNYFVGNNGGNVIAGGVNMKLGDFSVDPFLLFNTSIPGSDEFLFQLGLRFGFDIEFVEDWYSKTQVRALFQLANQDMSKYKVNTMLGYNNDDVGFLIWGDQEFSYQDWVKFGAGLYYVGGQGIWHINDNTRFYGSWVNALGINYFGEDMYSFYGFGQFNLINDKLSIDLLAAGGNYTEFSAVVKYQVWQATNINMKTDIGGGYVYASQSDGYSGGHLLVFAKLSY